MAPGEMEATLKQFIENIGLRQHVDKLRYKKDRRAIWKKTRQIRTNSTRPSRTRWRRRRSCSV